MSEQIKQFSEMTPEADQTLKGFCDMCEKEKDHLYWTSEGNIIGVTFCLDCLEEMDKQK